MIRDHPTTDGLHRALVAAINRPAQQLDALERSLAALNKQMADLRYHAINWVFWAVTTRESD